MSITYDDGPHPEHTPRLLDLLAARGETATFFALARQVRAHPEIARRILADGHELALHGQDHRSLLTMGDGEAVRYVRDAKDEVESIVSAPLVSFRPPYGAHTVRQAYGIAGLGMDVLIWSGDAFDWVDDEEERIAERALSTIFPGACSCSTTTGATRRRSRPTRCSRPSTAPGSWTCCSTVSRPTATGP